MKENTRDGNASYWWKDCSKCGLRFKDEMHKVVGVFPIKVKEFETDLGICPSCKVEGRKYYEQLFSAVNLHWTEEDIREHFTKKPPCVGQELIILDTSWNINTYTLVKVSSPSHTKQKRIIIESYSNGYSGQSFYRNGKNCYSPKGQLKLLPYNETIADLIKKNGGKQISLQSNKVLELIGSGE